MNKKIITISREFGSGGRTVGKEVAERLGWKFYDKMLVDEIAKESGFAKEFIAEAGEYASTTKSFLFNLAMSLGSSANGLSLSDQLYVAQNNIIREISNGEPCVIVGRCADFILSDRSDTFNVFVYADREFRKKRIVEQYGELTDTPEKRLTEKDEKRKLYYKYYTHRDWGVAQNYNICLDTGTIGIERCCDIIVDAVNALNAE